MELKKILLYDNSKENADEFIDIHREKYFIKHVSNRIELEEELDRCDNYDIILVDMYSRVEMFDGSPEEYENAKKKIHESLNDFQKSKNRLYSSMRTVWNMDGVSVTKNILELTDKKFTVPPIAIFSKYGRRMISTEQLNQLTGRNVYWAWKHKLFKPLDPIKDKNVIAKEQQSINDIIQINKIKKENSENTINLADRRKEKMRSSALTNLEALREKYEISSAVNNKSQYFAMVIVGISAFSVGFSVKRGVVDFVAIISMLLTFISILITYDQYAKSKINNENIKAKFENVKKCLEDDSVYYYHLKSCDNIEDL